MTAPLDALVRHHLLRPLGVLLLLLLASFAAALTYQQARFLDEHARQRFADLWHDWEHTQADQARTLAAILDTMALDPQLRDGMRRGDRAALLAKLSPFLAHLRRDTNITHLYVHDRLGVNLLRVHDPAMFGDQIERHTLGEAALTGRAATGLEVGTLGGFSLRAAMPVFDGDTLLGYLELGKEIDDLLQQIYAQNDVDLAILLRKTAVARSDWERGIGHPVHPGRKAGDWARFPDDVAVYSTLPEFPAAAVPLVDETAHRHAPHDSDIVAAGTAWRVALQPIEDASGAKVGHLFAFIDLTAEKAAQRHFNIYTMGVIAVLLLLLYLLVYRMLRRTDEVIRVQQAKLVQAASVFEHSHQGILITDAQGTIVDANAALVQITGYSREECIGQTPRLFKSDHHPPAFYADIWCQLHAHGYWVGEIWNRRKNGEVYAEMRTISAIRDEAGRTIRYVALFSDISVQKEHQAQLERIAHFDALTGLPNRVLLADRLQQALIQAHRRATRVAVAYIDLDGFKAVNDTHGHAAGDHLLRQLALRMGAALREGDTLARIGGDEFVAVLADLLPTQDCDPIFARLLQAAAEPVAADGASLRVSASMGIAFYTPNGAPAVPDLLLRHADQAMYRAKQAGKNRYAIFEPEADKVDNA